MTRLIASHTGCDALRKVVKCWHLATAQTMFSSSMRATLRAFIRIACENALEGCFNLSGPRQSWADFIAMLAAQRIAWVPARIIKAAGITEFELPLYRPSGGPRSSLMHVSNERAVAVGLRLTDPATTVADVRAWLPRSVLTSALTPEGEAALIEMSRAELSRKR